MFLHRDAHTEDVIQAFLHVSYARYDKQEGREKMDLLTGNMRRERDMFVATLKSKGWLVDSVYWGDNGHRLLWEIDNVFESN